MNKHILAFIHIEKAAGQTFIRILENNYVYRHCRVAPLKKEHNGVFQFNDLRLLLKLNPFICALAGHSIVPYSDLSSHGTKIRYVTILRDPVKRYISHYQYWVQALKKHISFEEFLSLEDINNFQIKKIAGTEDLAVAKSMLQEKIFLAGIVEEFEEFLIVLKNKLAPDPFDIAYERRNVAKTNMLRNHIYDRFEEYEQKILQNNHLDMQLYEYVKDELFIAEKERYLGSNRDLSFDSTSTFKKIRRYIIGKLYRNLYIGPLVNLIRYKNGLKVGGSY